MAGRAYPSRIAFAAAAISMLVTPIAATAQPASAPISAARVDPLVAFSLFGSADSRAALCGLRSASDATTVATAIASTSTGGATTTDQSNGGMAGCVLPMRDAAALPAETAAPVARAGVPSFMFLALGGALVWIALILRDKSSGMISPA